jgi:hypothetical protein
MTTKTIPSLLLFACLLGVCAVATPIFALQSSTPPIFASNDVSGMYTFLREGEFVQLTLEEGRLTGYVSRFGDSESDRGQFIDQFFDKASLQGEHLSFNTKTVHGIWYDFNGTISIASGRKPGEDGYRVIKGTLVQHATDAKGAEKAMQRQVEFKSFPADLTRP